MAFGLQAIAGSTQDTLELKELLIQDSITPALQSGFTLHLKPDERRLGSDRSLSDYLSRMTSLRFKDYGPGLTSTPTFRSGDANHTQVIWNGFVLNSPMLGSVDFSNLPVSQFRSIDVYSGNSSNLYTNGALGGSVHINQSAESNDDGLLLEAGGGSFGNFGGNFRYQSEIKSKKSKTSLSLTGELLQLNNRFRYKNTFLADNPRELMKNSQFSRANMSANLKTVFESSDIQLIYWYSGSDRQIPQPLNFYSNTSQNQKDYAHRVLMGFNKKLKNDAIFNAKIFYENNQNIYIDTVWGIDNNNRFQTIQTQISYSQRLISRLKLNVRLNPNWTEASTDNYAKTHDALSVNGVVLLEGFWLSQNRLVSELGVRMNSFADDYATTPFGGLTYYIIPSHLGLFGSYSENVRFPTFNERHWNPGGNINLNPERAKMLEGGVRYKKGQMLLQALAFHGDFTDRIRWVPSSGWIYSPINIDQSRSRGVEINYSHEVKIKNGGVFWSANANWTQAQWMTDTSEFQLSYVPNLAAGVNAGFRVSSFRFIYGHQYSSERFIVSDESSSLPSYHIGTLSMSYKPIDLEDSHSLELRFEINNIWDSSYQIMPWRPMPGREFVFTLRYSL